MEREVTRYCQAEAASWVISAGGVGAGALAVAAVVEGEDVGAEGVEGGECGVGVGEGAVAVGEEEDGDGGVTAAGRGGDPDAGELRDGGFVGAEVDEFEAELEDAGVGWVGWRTSCHWP